MRTRASKHLTVLALINDDARRSLVEGEPHAKDRQELEFAEFRYARKYVLTEDPASQPYF